MKTVIFIIIAIIATGAMGGINNNLVHQVTIVTEATGGVVKTVKGIITKEHAMKRVTVRLVRKTWRPGGYDPNTDEPLQGFTGDFKTLFDIFQKYEYKNKYEFVAQPLVNATKLFSEENFDKNKPILIITHPMAIGESLFITQVIVALALRNLHKHYNIFAMHAPWLSWQFQISCARVALGLDPMFKPVAEAFASFLLDGIKMGLFESHQINFIGFSYSATLNAYIAREIRDSTGHLSHTLITLDAFQYNKNNTYFQPISKTDAMYVHMFHSSSRFGGTSKRIGTVDIVVNNGFIQPGCEDAANSGATCSHRRSVPVFIFAVLALGNVVARQCDSWEKFYKCKCSDPSHALLIVSFPVNEEARGTFYLRTDNMLPYVLGPRGAYCEAELRELYNKKKVS